MALDLVDESLARLGKYSRWHILVVSFLCIPSMFATSPCMLSIIFTGLFPYFGYQCNVTDPRMIPGMVPADNETVNPYLIDRCNVYVNWTVSNETQACPNGYTYTTDIETIVTEWNLLCSVEYLKDMSQMITTIGATFGAVVFGCLADRFGRKPIFFISNVGLAVGGVITAVSPDFTFFTITRFITGVFGAGLGSTGYILACELYPAKQRTFVGQSLCSVWGIAMMVATLVAYFVRNWRNYYLATSTPFLICTLAYWFIPESVPWLITNGRRKEAEAIMRQAAKFNGLDLPEHVLTMTRDPTLTDMSLMKMDEEEKPELEVQDEVVSEPATVFFTHPRLRLYSICMIFIWFVNALVYFGLQFTSADLGSDLYMIMFLAGIMDVVAYFHSIWVLERWGRRLPLVFYHVLAAVGLIVSILIPSQSADGTDLNGLIIFFNMLGRLGIASSFSIIYLFASELIPTNLRNLGLSLYHSFASVAGIIAPYTSTVMRRITWLPALVFGGLCITAAALSLVFAETLHKVLPASTADLDKFDKKRGRTPSMQVNAPKEKNGTAEQQQDIRV